jgi:hypothetical protein
MKTWMAFFAGMSLVVLTGCKAQLETGYVPRPLGSSTVERRGYYARPFSQEAIEAQIENEKDDQYRPASLDHSD